MESQAMLREVVIAGAARTPIGSFQGALASVPAPVLGGLAIAGALRSAGLDPAASTSLSPGHATADAGQGAPPIASASASIVGEVLMGCVLQAGLGQAPARQAAHQAGLSRAVGAVTINKVCGSGLMAVVMGAQAIATGAHDVVVAGGMESMSNAPYLVPGARNGLRMGEGKLLDSMITDGLWDPYGDTHMGACAELCAREKKISRAEQDAYAAESYRRAVAASTQAAFAREVCAVPVAKKKGPSEIIATDEEPGRKVPERLPTLRPAFVADGTITAGNASSLNDGAAAVVVCAAEVARTYGLPVRARIIGYAVHAQAPEWFTTAPAGAIEKLLARIGWVKDDVDLWEINEAFAVVALVNIRLLGLDPARVNVRGGAVALGHPIGASGARILVTLLHALEDQGGTRGIAALCIGGGEGIALAIERV